MIGFASIVGEVTSRSALLCFFTLSPFFLNAHNAQPPTARKPLRTTRFARTCPSERFAQFCCGNIDSSDEGIVKLAAEDDVEEDDTEEDVDGEAYEDCRETGFFRFDNLEEDDVEADDVEADDVEEDDVEEDDVEEDDVEEDDVEEFRAIDFFRFRGAGVFGGESGSKTSTIGTNSTSFVLKLAK